MIEHCSTMFNHENLRIWQRSHALTVDVHNALKTRARSGPSGTAAQLIRSCASVPTNIAEAAGQDTPAQTARYLDFAIGSLSETQSHLSLACATGMLRSDLGEKFADEVRQLRRMTVAFRKWIVSHRAAGNPEF